MSEEIDWDYISTAKNQYGRALTLNETFVENSTLARQHVKRKILKNNLIEYVCCKCGLGPEWYGKPMPLILDHENGINNDNRIENLRFVCSNCDTQLPTYKSKNIKNKKKIGELAESGLSRVF